MIKKILIFSFILFTFIFISNNSNKVNAEQFDDNLPECYQQNDPRWGFHVNGNGNIASSACGILSLTNSVNYLTGNFINPIEIADYAYSINAYNIPAGGGIWRDLFYGNIKCFEQKYGFKVTTASIYKGITDKRLKNHLMAGGVSIAHVYGHFIAIVGYDEGTNTYLVYDSAANYSKRHTYAKGTWLIEEQLSEGYMEVDWFCLIEKRCERETSLDGYRNLRNGRVETTITYNKLTDDLPIVSGTALVTGGVKEYYYEMCPANSFEPTYLAVKHPLETISRYLETTNESFNHNDRFAGFKGVLDLKECNEGNYYVFVYAESLNGLKVCIAQIVITVIEKEQDVNAYEFQSGNVTKIKLDKLIYAYESTSILNEDETLFDLRNVKYIYIDTNSSFDSLVIKGNSNLDYSEMIGFCGKQADFTNIINCENMSVTKKLYLFNDSNNDVTINSISFYYNDAKELYESCNDGTHKVLTSYNGDVPNYTATNCTIFDNSFNATCTTDGLNYKYCLECGYEEINEIITAFGHIGDDLYYDDNGHFHICDVCNEEFEREDHQMQIGYNRTKHFDECTTCGYTMNFENHNYGDDHLCAKCHMKDPNYKESSVTEPVTPLPSSDEVPTPSKKGCKKNVGIYIIQLLTIASLTGIFIKRRL